MSSPNSADSKRDRDIKRGAKHDRHRSVHREKACPNPPAAPSTITESFQVTEDRTALNFAPKVSWAAVTRDEQGHKIDIHQYVVQMVATSGGGLDAQGMGPPVELEDGKPRLREMHKNIPKHDANGNSTDPADDFFVVYPEVPRPKTWYWQARVAAVDEKGCQGDFTPWTNQRLPWQTDSGRGAVPTPSGVAMIFDTEEKSRHDRYRAEVTFNEIRNWDIPGGDHQEDVKGYVVELQAGTNNYPPGMNPTTWLPHTRERTPEAGTAATKTVVFEKIHKHYYYRARARTIDRFNRRSDWSNWVPNDSPGATPSDNVSPPQPTALDLNMNGHEARITWDEVIDPASGILHQDVAFFQVQLAKDAGYNNVALRDHFCITQHKVFKLDKPKGDWYARVQAVDAAGNQSGWAAYPQYPSARDTPRKPPAVPNVRVDFILQEPGKWAKVKARVRWDAVQEASDDIDHYIVELESGDVVNGDPKNTFSKDGNRWTGHVKAAEVTDDAGTLEATETTYAPDAADRRLQFMHPAKRGHWYRARVRAVDKDGQAGSFGPTPPEGWSGNGAHRQKCSPPNAQVLKVPQNVHGVASVRGVGIRWTHPQSIDADTGLVDGFRDESIDFFRVQVSTERPAAGWSPTVTQEDDVVHGRRVFYNASEWTNQAGPFYLAVQSVDHIGNTSGWVYETDANGPVGLTPGAAALGPGDINDPSFFGGLIPPIVSRATLPVLPDPLYPAGSQVWLAQGAGGDNTNWVDATVINPNPNVSPAGSWPRRRFYKNKANVWTAEIFAVDLGDSVQAGNIAANAIRAVHIRAGEITGDHFNANVATATTFVLRSSTGTGGAFRTDNIGASRIEMSQVDGPDRLAFVNGASSGGNLGRVFLVPATNTPAGGTRRDLIDLTVPGNVPSQADSGLRWGNTAADGTANSRLLNSGAIQLGSNGLAVGDSDAGTIRLFWDNANNLLKIRIGSNTRTVTTA